MIASKLFISKDGKRVIAVEVFDKETNSCQIMLNQPTSTFSSLVSSGQIDNARWTKDGASFVGSIPKFPYDSMCAKFKRALKCSGNFYIVTFEQLRQALSELANGIDSFAFYFTKYDGKYWITTRRDIMVHQIASICRRNPAFAQTVNHGTRMMIDSVNSKGKISTVNVSKEVEAEYKKFVKKSADLRAYGQQMYQG